MKQTTNLFKSLFLLGLTVILVAVGIVAVQVLFIGANAFTHVAAGTGGGLVEGSMTLERQNTSQPDLIVDSVSQKITKMRPASTPLHTIINNISKTVSVGSFRTEYYAVDIKPFTDTNSAVFTNSGSQTSGDITVGNVKAWSVDDTVMFPDIAGGDGLPLVGCVTSRNVGTNKITIQALNGTGAGTDVIPNIAITSTMVRMGQAKSELDMQTSAFSIIPEKDFNYCQNFMAQIEASTFDKIQDKEVAWDFSDYEELTIFDMKSAMERSYLFGIKKKFSDATDAEVKYACGGINSGITKGLTWSRGTGVTNTNFVSWAKSIFQDNAGSDTRIMFIGDDLMESMSVISAIEKQLDAKSTEIVHGVEFNKIVTNWGQLLIKRHPMFRMMGWAKNGLVLDIHNIEKHVHVPLKATKLDLIKSGQRNADATVLQEVSCPVLRYPATHARITSVA